MIWAIDANLGKRLNRELTDTAAVSNIRGPTVLRGENRRFPCISEKSDVPWPSPSEDTATVEPASVGRTITSPSGKLHIVQLAQPLFRLTRFAPNAVITRAESLLKTTSSSQHAAEC